MIRTTSLALLLLFWNGEASALSMQIEVTPETISATSPHFEMTVTDQDDEMFSFTLAVSAGQRGAPMWEYCSLNIYTETVDTSPVVTRVPAGGRRVAPPPASLLHPRPGAKSAAPADTSAPPLILISETLRRQPILVICKLQESERGGRLVYEGTVRRSILDQAAFVFVQGGDDFGDSYTFVLKKFADAR